MKNVDADLKVIAMDSNVTSLHPRFGRLLDAGYQLDRKHAIEQTYTNPLLNTEYKNRLDICSSKNQTLTIENLPVQEIGLNDPRTNMSDHKPIASKILY